MKKIRDYIKKNPEPARGRFGVNASDPWSAKYNVAEDLTTKQKGSGDSRSKVSHSPTQQRAAELDKAAKFYQVKNPTGTMGSKVHHEDKHMNKKEGNQNTALTPESVQKCNESPAGTMCEVHGMKACKTISEAKKKMSALDKWRQASYDREKAHKEFMKSIEHLPHHDQMQKMMDKIKSDRASVHNKEAVQHDPWKQKYFGPHTVVSNRKMSDKEKADWEKHKEWKKGVDDALASDMKRINKEEVRGELKHIRNKEAKMYNKEVDGFNKKVKEIHAEETITELSAKKLLGYMMKAGSKKDPKKDTKDRSKNTLKATGKYLKKIDELNKDTLKDYLNKSAETRKSAKSDLKTIEKRPEIYKDNTGKHQEKLATQAKKLSSTISKRTTGINRAFKKLHSTTEETYMDAKAATPAPMAPGEGISEKMTTAQRVMMLKKKKLKEDMHDHEKEDKSVATYGKKPKFEKAEKDNGGENKPSAAATMSGGTTLTGSKRDIVEIDPMMRNRPGQPDATKKDDKDKDKKKDK